MAHFLRILTQLIIAAGLAGSLLFYVTAYLSSRAFMRRQRRQRISRGGEGEWLPGMTVLKPLKGLDVDLFENLATFCLQDYPQYQVIFGVADPADPAVGVVRRLQAAFPRVRIDLVVNRRIYGTNYKVSNLHNMYQAAEHEVLVIADSDIRVSPDYLRRIVQPLRDSKVGLVTCLYRAVNTGGLPTLMESLFINTDFAAMVMVARVIERPTYAFGATMAMRRAVLDEIGGFLPLANYLADDYMLGHRIDERGYRLELSDLVVETVLAVGSWRRLLDHQLRWARTYRVCRPGGYFLSILTHGSFWALFALCTNHFSAAAWLVAFLLGSTRILTARSIAEQHMRTPMSLREALFVPLKDLFVSAVWMLCFLGDTVRWSGHEFRVLRDGQMVLVGAAGVAPAAAHAYSNPKADEEVAPI